jgi:hypothetical protein
MKKNEIVQSLSLIFKSRYNDLLLGTHNTILSCHLYRDFKVYKKLSYPYILDKGIKGKGIKFMLRRPDLGVYMFYELIDMIYTDYYSKFKYYIYKTIPESFEYIHQIEFTYLNENECHLSSFLIYNNKIIFSDDEFKKIIIFHKNLYKSIEYSLRRLTVLKVSTPYVVINCEIELIWKIIRNMKMIHKYVHLLTDKINYNGEIVKKNTIIELINIKGPKKYKSFAKVNKCKMDKYELSKECIIELLFQKDKEIVTPITKTKIVIRIYEYFGKCSMYILFFFNKAHHYETIGEFTKIKINELNKFKEIVENYKESNLDIKSRNIENKLDSL